MDHVMIHPTHGLTAIIDSQVAKMTTMVGVFHANDLSVIVNAFETVRGDYRIMTVDEYGCRGADVL